jgi:hypothetical protein
LHSTHDTWFTIKNSTNHRTALEILL